MENAALNGCAWLFGRGGSIANGLPWIVPESWKSDLLRGRIGREEHVRMIVEARTTQAS